MAAGAGCAIRPSEPVAVKILAINDFHGNLKTPSGGIRIKDPADASKTITVAAGGAEHLATAVRELRAKNPNHVFVAAGDLIGATPLLSALFRDEPTIESLSLMGLEVAAVGNHEFDKGWRELMRLQRGGCSDEGCKGPQPYQGAKFQYLAAGTVVEATGQTLFPAYWVKRFQNVPVGFVGLTLKDTPTIVVPAGVEGLRFRDEAEAINGLVPELRRQGVEAIVVLIHEGGVPSGDYNECPGISGPIVDIVKKLDKAVDVVISGHTHRAYNCRIDGRLVTSGDKYGTIVTQVDLVLDPKTGDVTSAVADNVIVRPERFAKDVMQTQLIAAYERLAVPLAKRVVGRIGAALPRDANPAGESALGQVIADAQLAASRDAGAQIALMNPGGIRAALALPADGQVRYEDLFSVQPFYNNLVTMTLTGAQLVQVLEQQWAPNQPGGGRILQVSRGFAYSWNASKPSGQRIVPGSLRLNGQPIAPDARLRVTVNSFLAGGGDNFTRLKDGTEVRTGMMDIDAFEEFVKRNPRLAPGALDRITRLN
jgi:5'-nucleotidase